MLLPVGGLDVPLQGSLSAVPGAVAGREVLVSKVTLTLMRPYAKARARYIKNDGPNAAFHGLKSSQSGEEDMPSQHASLVENGFLEQ